MTLGCPVEIELLGNIWVLVRSTLLVYQKKHDLHYLPLNPDLYFVPLIILLLFLVVFPTTIGCNWFWNLQFWNIVTNHANTCHDSKHILCRSRNPFILFIIWLPCCRFTRPGEGKGKLRRPCQRNIDNNTISVFLNGTSTWTEDVTVACYQFCSRSCLSG